ncbi:hypothetical protein Sjap_021229 [Stephania japonica]|uniref:Spermidine synthase n=1 Tax=Stephania japonica TaxID=461633 RepID=A0AAP0ERU7_9MAGN
MVAPVRVLPTRPGPVITSPLCNCNRFQLSLPNIRSTTKCKWGSYVAFASCREREGHGSTEEEEFKVLTADEFASLPAIVPRGPIAILGLGGGTSAHLILDSWPSLKLEGWEIDELLIDKAREYLGLCNLERSNQVGGVLCVHVGDALSPSATVPGGFAGIVVDLFSDGKILTQLEEVATWLELNNRLMCHGRIMVNCGGVHAEATDPSNVAAQAKLSQKGDLWIQNSTIKAMCGAFPGNLSWKKEAGGENYLALTGPMPDLDLWSNLVPDHLKLNVKQWKPCTLMA